MSTSNTSSSAAEVAIGTAGVLAGLGVITMVLFPFSLPLLLLTVATVLPLLVVPIVLAPIGLVAFVAWLGLRALVRGGRRLAGS